MSLKNGNPYVGPRTFSQEKREQELFFGRDEEAERLLSLVLSERLVLFYARSGAGKSSLLNARLIPDLKEKGFEVLPVARISGTTSVQTSEEANPFVYNLCQSLDQRQEGAVQLRGLTLSNFLMNLVQREDKFVYEAAEAELETEQIETVYEVPPRVLIIDQFEEILITHLDAWNQREEFFVQLREAMQDDPHLWVVLSMREDFVAALDPYAHLLPGRLRARFYMQPMGKEAAIAAVKKPALKGGRPFAPNVSEALVDDLRRVRLYPQAKPHLGQFVEPLQLQVVCYQLWTHLEENPPAEITQQDVDTWADVDDALESFYDQVVQEICQQTKVSEGEIRDWFSNITKLNTRAVVHQEEGWVAGLPENAVKLLADHFLLHSEGRGGGIQYELIHDRLVEPIKESNRKWEEQQSPLIRDARAWQGAGQADSKLYTGQQLKEALATVEVGEQNALVVQFLEAGQRLQRQLDAEQAAKAAKRLRRLNLALLAMFLIMLFAAGCAILALFNARSEARAATIARSQAEEQKQLALTQSQARATAQAQAEAQEQIAKEEAALAAAARVQAEEQAKLTLSSSLAVWGLTVLDEDPELGVLLALRAITPTYTLEAEGSLRQSLQASQVRLTLNEHTNVVRDVAFSPNRKFLATVSDDGKAILWDLTGETMQSIYTITHPDERWLTSLRCETVEKERKSR